MRYLWIRIIVCVIALTVASLARVQAEEQHQQRAIIGPFESVVCHTPEQVRFLVDLVNWGIPTAIGRHMLEAKFGKQACGKARAQRVEVVEVFSPERHALRSGYFAVIAVVPDGGTKIFYTFVTNAVPEENL